MIKFDGKEYEDLATLEIEIDCNQLGWEFGGTLVNRQGKSMMRIMASDLPKVAKCVEDKWDVYLECQNEEKEELRHINNQNVSEGLKLRMRGKCASGLKRFRMRAGRPLKALKSLRVVSDLGILPSEENTRMKQIEQAGSMQDLFAQFLEMQTKVLEAQLEKQAPSKVK